MAANKGKQKLEAQRAARRAAARRAGAGAATTVEDGDTFGEVIAAAGLLAKIAAGTHTVIRRAEAYIVAEARVQLKVISCFACDAPKGCCSLTVIAALHEAVPIAAQLRGDGRDTEALRDRLRDAAMAMEAKATTNYRSPCVFLDADQRCTVYDSRPSACGTAFVSSPPLACSDPRAGAAEPFANREAELVDQIARAFAAEVDLIELPGPYLGVLPRMVLLCLRAWDRKDYAAYLAEHGLRAGMRAIGR